MSAKPRQKRSQAVFAWSRWPHWHKLVVAIATAAVMAVLFTIQLLPDRVSLRVGQIAPRDVIAHKYVRYLDDGETERLRALAAASIPPIYDRVAEAPADVERELTGFFGRVQQLRASPRATAPGIIAELRRTPPPGVPERALRLFLGLPPARLSVCRRAALSAAGDVMSGAVRDNPDDVRLASEQLPGRLSASGISDPERDAVSVLVGRSLRPNRILDEHATADRRAEERTSVQPVYREVNRGDMILRAGERVTSDHMARLVHLGLQHPRVDATRAVSFALLALALVGLIGLYLHQFQPRIFASDRLLMLIGLVISAALLLFRLGGDALDLRLSGDQTGYVGVMSAVLAAMLIAALLNQQVALLIGVVMATASALLMENPLKFAIIALFGSFIGVITVGNIRNRMGILRAALAVAAVDAVMTLVTVGATGSGGGSEIGQGVIWATIGAVGAVFLFVPTAALLERPFRLTTHLTLLELSDSNNPLLRRLAMDAPGTYAHSVIVGNLSEAAAKAIGADSLFARVASCYHDIGKVVRPHFFIENQLGENHHAGMSASLSCLVVTAHVRDGVELAEQHRLPPRIIDVIREHHGTCLIKYFYHRAVTSGGEDAAPALEYQFRYEGPRPQTKESGIIMLADAAEAASRTLEKPTPGRIRDLVETIVRDRLADAQLDECELTFKDLEKIVSSMTRSLSSLLHARVEYPALDTRELTRLGGDAPAGKELVATGPALADTPAPGAGAYSETA